MGCSLVGAESGTGKRRLQYQLYKRPLFTARKTTDPLKGCLNVLTSTEETGNKDSQKELVITKCSPIDFACELERIDIIEFPATGR